MQDDLHFPPKNAQAGNESTNLPQKLTSTINEVLGVRKTACKLVLKIMLRVCDSKIMMKKGGGGGG